MYRDIMIRIASLLLLVVTAGAVAGCEDRINLDLRNSEPKLVIEGELGHPYGAMFRLSRTSEFYQPNAMEKVSGALIAITDNTGRADTLHEYDPDNPGLYANPYVNTDFGGRYQATVTVDDRTYTASTTMPHLIEIDSISTEYQKGDGLGPEEDPGYRLHVYFGDKPGVEDYARVRLQNTPSVYQKYYLYDGKFSDGNAIDYDYFFDIFQVGDAVSIELISMDKQMYYYFLTLADVVATEDGTNSFDVTPANPNTNWSGGALGYFGAFQTSEVTLIVRDQPELAVSRVSKELRK